MHEILFNEKLVLVHCLIFSALGYLAKNVRYLGSGCGSVGRVDATNTRGPRFESSHRQKFIYLLNICLLSTVYWKEENKEKRGLEWPIFKKCKIPCGHNEIHWKSFKYASKYFRAVFYGPSLSWWKWLKWQSSEYEKQILNLFFG